MIHPSTRLAPVDDRVGLGVVATEAIPKGTIVWVRDPLDMLISRAHARSLGPLFRDSLRHFTFWEHDGDLMLCWDHARYVNHSCEANCFGGGFEFEIAVRHIDAGEQLTDDYACFGYASQFACTCGAARCRGVVKGSDAHQMAPIWDAQLIDALQALRDVDQPLWNLLTDPEAALNARLDPALVLRHRVA